MSEDLLPKQGTPAAPRASAAGQGVAAPTSAFPGWYPDPSGHAAERFWNGGRWTTRTKGVPPSNGFASVGEMAPTAGSVASAGREIRRDEGPEGIRIVADRGDDIKILPSPNGAETEPTAYQLPERGEEVVEGEPEQRQVSAPQDRKPLADRPLFGVTTSAEDRRITVPKLATGQGPERPEQRTPRRAAWLAVAAAAVIGCGLGYGLGSASRQQETVEAQANLNESVRSALAAGETTPAGDAQELQRRLDSLSTELSAANDELTLLRGQVDSAAADVDEARDARDRLAAHNTLLKSWFTDDLQDQAQAEWDAEVDRVCGQASPNQPVTTEQLQFSQTMELVGTQDDLLAAVQACLDS